LSPEDKISTLTEFTVQGISNAQTFCEEAPKVWYVCGGGRHNKEMMKRLSKTLQGDILSIDNIGINGDMLEAEGFAYLAVRSVKELPLSLPTTTGVRSPQNGGRYKKVA
ncbi:MAG: anhydro-N-acetylmuramic acid kinase, partial [Bdellovibrionales bacterium]